MVVGGGRGGQDRKGSLFVLQAFLALTSSDIPLASCPCFTPSLSRSLEISDNQSTTFCPLLCGIGAVDVVPIPPDSPHAVPFSSIDSFFSSRPLSHSPGLISCFIRFGMGEEEEEEEEEED